MEHVVEELIEGLNIVINKQIYFIILAFFFIFLNIWGQVLSTTDILYIKIY